MRRMFNYRTARTERDKLRGPILEKTRRPILAPMVHGKMIYLCQGCGAFSMIYLEMGVEDHGKHGRLHQPSPFSDVCAACRRAIMYDVSGYIPITERSLFEGEYYYAYDKERKDGCGILKQYRREQHERTR